MLQLLADTFSDPYSVNYTTTSTSTNGGVAAGLIIGYFVFLIVVYFVTAFILSKVFVKAGRKASAAYIPFYNNWVLLELGGQNGAHVFWNFLPFVGPVVYLVFYIMAMLELAKRFGKSPAFAIVGLVIFSLIGFIMLGFGDASYSGGPGVAQAAAGGMPPTPEQPNPYVAQSQPPVQPPQSYEPQTVAPQNGSDDNTPPSAPQPPTNVVQG